VPQASQNGCSTPAAADGAVGCSLLKLDLGVPYGPQMEAFVNWAYERMGGDPDHDSADDTRYSELPI